MVSLTATLGASVVLGSFATAIYVLLLHLRKDAAESTAYRAFRYGYPVAAAVLLVSLVGVLSVAGRFRPIGLLGASLDPSLVRTLGLAGVTVGLIAAGVLTVWVGFDRRSGSAGRS